MGLNFQHVDVLAFIIILTRVGAMIVWFPIFGERTTPVLLKILFSVVVTLIVYPIVKSSFITIPTAILPLVILLFQEIAVGILIGLISKLIFYTVALASQLISFQMGFGIVSILDPITGGRVSIVNQFQVIVASLLFLLLNVHHLFFDALITSFSQVAPGSLVFAESFLKEIIEISATVFVVGFKIAAPVAVVLLVTNAGLGVLARAVPQMNVFMVSFPLTIGLGLIILGLSVPLFTHMLGAEFNNIGDNILRVLKTI